MGDQGRHNQFLPHSCDGCVVLLLAERHPVSLLRLVQIGTADWRGVPYVISGLLAQLMGESDPARNPSRLPQARRLGRTAACLIARQSI